MTFEEYVTAWDELCQKKAKLEKQLKPIKDEEMKMRKHITEALIAAKGSDLKEGANSFELVDGRTLKFANDIKREIENSEIENARKAYNDINDKGEDIPFDNLLRVKFELNLPDYRKLTEAQQKAIADMITSKPGAAKVEIV